MTDENRKNNPGEYSANADGQIVLPGFKEEKPTAEPGERDKLFGMLEVIAFQMDLLIDPEDAIGTYTSKNPGTKKIMDVYLSSYLEKHFNLLCKIVARETGADPEQLADKKRRTPEQQEALRKAAAELQAARMDKFFNSRFMKAKDALVPLCGKYAPVPGEPKATPAKEQAVFYFFARHEELDPRESDPLTEEHIKELIGIFWRLDAFYTEKVKPGETVNTGEIFKAFIEEENPEPDAAQLLLSQLPLLQGLNPESHTMPNNPLMNVLQQKKTINEGAFDLIVSGENGRRKEITAYTMITLDPGETDITITDAKLSEYERQVSDAIVSLWIEANNKKLPPVVTADMIFRAMPGGGDKASPQQRGAITKAIEKFRRLRIYVDATEEMQRRGYDLKGGKYVFDENYLQVRRHTFRVKNGGAVVQGYEILSQPIVYTYCKLTKQLLTTPADNILIREVKDGFISPVPIMMNANRQALTGYMLRRILVMKRSREAAREKKRSYDAKRKKAEKSGEYLPEKPLEDFIEQKPVILFATMFADTGTETASRSQTQDNRDFCFSVLDYWKATGLIKGYSIRKTGRAITALEIDL